MQQGGFLWNASLWLVHLLVRRLVLNLFSHGFQGMCAALVFVLHHLFRLGVRGFSDEFVGHLHVVNRSVNISLDSVNIVPPVVGLGRQKLSLLSMT
jgi:hypothetical protein